MVLTGLYQRRVGLDETYSLVSLFTHVCQSEGVSRVVSGEVEIVPGVVGRERIVNEWPLDTRAGTVNVRMEIRFDAELARYVCHELTVSRDPANPHSGPVTTELLRQVPIEEEISAALRAQALLAGYGGEIVEMRSSAAVSQPAITRELDNPGQVEPWGVHVPDEATQGGPTNRVLRWVAHAYRLGHALSYGGTKAVEELLEVPRSTAGRWVKLAREAGYLGPAEGPGRPGV
jgi:hypothetical protein